MTKQPAIYILTNKRNGTLYTGVTSNLIERIYQHKTPHRDSFAQKYGCNQLVYFELLGTMEDAIKREKQIKGGSRKKKLQLIETLNPDWDDLYKNIL